MNRATVLVIVVAVVAIGGFTYWSGTRPAGDAPASVDGAAAPAAVTEGGDASATTAPGTTETN